ncbi:MAG: DUF3098 domain-containing protein [Flavobacteriales bacterium]|jgi:hypothetical protein|nr:DUF3098 domain-containing protein [Flavobacteriales bacterium]
MSNNRLAIPVENYKYILIGLIITVIGFFLMEGGGSEDVNVFIEEELFSFRRITLAPFVVMTGFGIVLYAILKRPKQSEPTSNSTEE